MNSFERVMNTLTGKPADRAPVFAVLGAWGGKLAGIDVPVLYTNAKAWVDAQRLVQDTFGLDLILATFDFSAIAEAFGCEPVYFPDQAPNMKCPLSLSLEAVSKQPLPDPASAGRLPVILDATQQLSGLYAGRVPVFAVIPSPCDLPILIFGIEAWLEVLLFDYPAALRFMQYTERFWVEWGNALLAAGANGLVMPESLAAQEITTRDIFAEKLLSHLRDSLGAVKGPVVFHHGGGRISHILDLLPGLPNLAGVAVGPRDDLAEARRLLGPELALIGNLDNIRLAGWTADETWRHSMACLESAGSAGRFILCQSAADLPISTPAANIHAMVQASRDHAGISAENR